MDEPQVKILAIDDNQDNLVSLRALIKDAFDGCVVQTAASGARGIELALAASPHVILLDVVMPGMDGFATCRNLKANPQTRDIPVVFLTAIREDKQARIRALEVGGDAFLAKPIDELELIAQIRAMVKINNLNKRERLEKETLARLVDEKTKELQRTQIATLNLLQDLSEENEARKLKEIELRESESRYRSLIVHSPDAIFVNHQDQVILVNEACLKLFGARGPEELLGKSIYELFHPDFHPVIQNRVGSLREPGMLVPVLEEKIVRLDGAIVDVDVLAASFSFRGAVDIHVILRDITERKQAEESLKHQKLLQENIAALGRALAATLNLPVIYQTAERHLKTMTDCSGFGVSLFDPKRSLLTLEYLTAEGAWIDPSGLPPLKLQPESAAGGWWRAISIQTPVILHGVETTQSWGCGMSESRSAVYIPMIVEDQVIGLVELHSHRADAYSAGDGEWLSVVANQIGLAIQNARLLAQTRQRVADLQVIHVIDQAIATRKDPREVYQTILEQVLAQPYVDAADILLLNSRDQALDFAAGLGFLTSQVESTHLGSGAGLAGRAVSEKQAVIATNPSGQITEFFHSSIWEVEGFRGYVGIPLVMQQEVKGVLEVFSRGTIPEDPDWLSFIKTLAQQVAIAVDNIQLFQNLILSNQELVDAYNTTIAGWSKAMDMRDKETEGHTERVTEMTLQVARALGLPEEKLVHVRRGALLHDIGKLGVPDYILYKPGSLTAEEWNLMKQHPVLAYEMLNPIDYLRPAIEIPYCHHEKWDGSGYPRGLRGEQIPLEARIFALVDVYDALITRRPYREAWQREDVLAYIQEQSGKQFDPAITAAFLKMIQ